MARLTEFYRQQRRRGHPPPIRARLDESSARSGRWGQAGRRSSFVEERRSRDERTPPPPPSVPPDLYCEEGVGGEKGAAPLEMTWGAAPPEVSRGPPVLLLDAATNTRPLLLLPRLPRARAHGRPPKLARRRGKRWELVLGVTRLRCTVLLRRHICVCIFSLDSVSQSYGD
jgi:hypothetical protein